MPNAGCHQRALWLATPFFVIAYVLMLMFFREVDVYHRHFFDTGTMVAVYQWVRLVLAAYLGWMVYAVGWGVLKLACGRIMLADLNGLQRFVFSFFTGIGVLSAVMLALGLAGLYSHTLAVSLSLAVVVVSAKHFVVCVEGMAASLKRAWRDNGQHPLVVLTGLFVFFYLVIRGLYPGGGHDYFTHYFYYYQQVIDTGSVLPGAVWYHFFYSKGAGLYFLAMLLSDPLAPQLAGLVFVMAGAVLVYAILAESFAGTPWPWAAAGLFVALMTYTHSDAVVSWGYLEKLHVASGICLFGALWCFARLRVAPSRGCWLAFAGAVFATVAMTLPLGGVLGLYFLCYAPRCWRVALTAMVMTGAAMIAMLGINWWVTGLPSDQVIAYVWPWLDFDTLAQALGLGEVVQLYHTHTQLGQEKLSLGFTLLAYLPFYLRLNMLLPLLLVVVFFYLRRQRASWLVPAAARWLGVLVGVYGVLALAGGREQFDSFHRLSVFMVAPVIALLMLLVAVAARTVEREVAPKQFAFAVVVLTVLSAWPLSKVSLMSQESFRLLAGKVSLHDAYADQRGWPGRQPWGGIYPAAEKAWEIAGRNTRIWSFHVISYCMLPDCRMESYMSFRLSPRWDAVMFGAPEQARAILQEEGLDYFFFSTKMPLESVLPRAPLFDPAQMGRFFSVRWTDGTSWLLTWKTPGLPVPDAVFTQEFTRAVAESETAQRFDFEGTKELFERVREQGNNVLRQWGEKSP